MLSSSNFSVVLTTSNRKEELEKIGDILLKDKLAACVQISGPVQSKYWWKGKIEASEEYLMVIKTHMSYFEKIKEVILRNHSYKEPELIEVGITNGTKGYLNWLGSVLSIDK